ncbi:sentrin-specific protease 2-like [Melanerpes formicivorus]|uniref:sentrin-specific protease 2-like n=1 Tax=Melanerpes formicivorus TaxID=211600 RepID=UPI00358E7F49
MPHNALPVDQQKESRLLGGGRATHSNHGALQCCVVTSLPPFLPAPTPSAPGGAPEALLPAGRLWPGGPRIRTGRLQLPSRTARTRRGQSAATSAPRGPFSRSAAAPAAPQAGSRERRRRVLRLHGRRLLSLAAETRSRLGRETQQVQFNLGARGEPWAGPQRPELGAERASGALLPGAKRKAPCWIAVQLVEDEEQEVPRKKQKSAEVTSDAAGEVSVARKRPLKAKEKPQGSAARGPAAEALEAAARAALGPGDPREVLSSAFKLRVTREAMGTLREGQWLNDEVINFYLQLVAERSRKAGYPSVHAFSTFFYPRLVSGGYEGVRRWTRGLDIFQKDIILVPIHLGIHWALVVIDVRRKTISYYHSLGQRGMKICQALLQYLQEESRSRRGLELASAEWALHSMGAQEIPQQRNQSDCGVFLCKYAESICRDRAITFSQRHMPSFRKKMVWEILHQQLL